MREVVAIISALVLSLALIGCSPASNGSSTDDSSKAPSKKTSEDTKETLVITESGYDVDDDGYVAFGLGIKNPNSGYEVKYPTITITGKDEDGAIVFSSEETLSFILPNGEYYVGGFAGNGTEPDTVEFEVNVRKNNYSKNDKEAFEIYTIENTNEVKGSYGQFDWTGEITANAEWSDIQYARVSALLRDDDGAIVAGYSTVVDIDTEGQTVPFDISGYDVPEHSSFEVYALPG